jgi:hypothetical protein
VPPVTTDISSEVQTWAEFNTAVRDLLPLDNARLGVQTYIDKLIRQSVIEIQGLIPFYRVGHQTTYLAADFTDNGASSEADMDNSMQIQEAILKRVSDDDEPITVIHELSPHAWEDRHEMILGSACLNDNMPRIAINPYGSQFLVYPKLEAAPDDGSTWSVILTWDGIKLEFEDADETPFDEPMALCVAEYVRAKIERESNKDLNMHNSYLLSYREKRRELFLNCKERLGFRRPAG